MTVLDVKSQQFYPKFRGFEKAPHAVNNAYDRKIQEIAFIPDESMIVYTRQFSGEVVFSDIKTGEQKRYMEGRTNSMSRDMRFPTMWCVQPAKAHTSLRICAV